MIGIRLLTPSLRRKLKSPLGVLIRGSFAETMDRLRGLVEEEKPSILISVGDVVSDNMVRHGIQPKVLIVDNRVMRKEIEPIRVEADQTLHLENLAGTLTDEAWTVVGRALKDRGVTRVVVDGEEDLLTLVVVLCAPEGSLVVYGQPREGVVVVKVTGEKREHVRQIVDAMRCVRDCGGGPKSLHLACFKLDSGL